jgi:hypothetical protein
MTGSDVSDFLNMSPNEVPQTVTLPEGSYDFVITSYRSDRVGEKINVKATGVIQSDLDEADIANAEPTRLEYWATPNAMKQKNPAMSLKSFLTDALDMAEDQSFGELLEQAIGQSFSGVVKHEMVGKNKDILQASIKKIINR